MRILVTGGCGFIASNFIRFLYKAMPDVFVVNVDLLTYAGNPASVRDVAEKYAGAYAFVQADIADKNAMQALFKQHSFDAIVNFAAESHVDRSIHDPTPFLRTNITGTQTLLTLAKAYDIPKFLHVSTDEVYGTLGPTGKFTENTPLAPNSPYSASKASADLFCRAWYETYGYPVVITRCSNNYGPYQFPEKLIPLMYIKARNAESLPVYGDGNNVRDCIHVEDHCNGVWLALTRGMPGKVYNLGGDAERTNMEVVTGILDYCNKPHSLIRHVADRPGHDKRYAMDFALARKELGFAPAWTFERGLEQTLNWYANNQQWVGDVTSGAYREFAKLWYGGRQ